MCEWGGRDRQEIKRGISRRIRATHIHTPAKPNEGREGRGGEKNENRSVLHGCTRCTGAYRRRLFPDADHTAPTTAPNRGNTGEYTRGGGGTHVLCAGVFLPLDNFRSSLQTFPPPIQFPRGRQLEHACFPILHPTHAPLSTLSEHDGSTAVVEQNVTYMQTTGHARHNATPDLFRRKKKKGLTDQI